MNVSGKISECVEFVNVDQLAGTQKHCKFAKDKQASASHTVPVGLGHGEKANKAKAPTPNES